MKRNCKLTTFAKAQELKANTSYIKQNYPTEYEQTLKKPLYRTDKNLQVYYSTYEACKAKAKTEKNE